MNIVELLKSVCKDSYRKNIFKIIYEVALCFLRKSEVRFYFTNLLYKRYNTNIEDYLSYKEYSKIQRVYINPDSSSSSMIRNKNSFYSFMKKHDLPTPKELFLLNSGVYESNELCKKFSSVSDVLSIFLSYLEQRISFFLKKSNSEGGEGIYKVSLNNLDEVIKCIYPDLQKHSYRAEETIYQHPLLSKVNPNSVNTLRVVTHKDINGKITIPVCILRFGINNTVVDNASLGGAFVIYDCCNERFDKYAHSFFKYGGKTYYKHPKTSFVFEGASLPYTKEVICLVKKGAELLKNKIIGWDIAITKDGPMVVEANDRPHLTFLQIGCKGFMRSKIFEEIYNKCIKTELNGL